MIVENTALAISIARGLIKLAGRADRLLAEKEGVTADLILTMPPLTGGPSGVRMAKELRESLIRTGNDRPDPFAAVRTDMEYELSLNIPNPAKITRWYTVFFPEKAIFPLFDPDSEYIRNLKAQSPQADLSDRDVLAAAFYIGPGKDQRQIGYTWKMALLVTDVLAEFGAENTALFTRDKGLRAILKEVLTRFSKPDFESYNAWSPFLRVALAATLNGVLDAREAYQGRDQWLIAILNALAKARAETQDGDNYILGLIQGRGYNLLINHCMDIAAKTLDSTCAVKFEKMAGELLKKAAPLVQENTSFRTFFKDHWSDLLRAGLSSLEKHGPVLLEDSSPLLHDTLLAVIKELSNETDAQLLNQDMLLKIIDAAVGAIFSDPGLLVHNGDEPWLKIFIGPILKTLGDQGIRDTFTKKGLEEIISNAAGTIAKHPELIIKEPGLFQTLLGGILMAVKNAGCMNADSIAAEAVSASLKALMQNPGLINTGFPSLVADCAGKLANLLAAKKMNRDQAVEIITIASQAVLLNPMLLGDSEKKLVEEIIGLVVKVAEKDTGKLIAGTMLAEVARQALKAVARRGAAILDTLHLDQFLIKIEEILDAGMTRAREDLGKYLDIQDIPSVLSGLITAYAIGDIEVIDPDDQVFVLVFRGLACE